MNRVSTKPGAVQSESAHATRGAGRVVSGEFGRELSVVVRRQNLIRPVLPRFPYLERMYSISR